MMIIAIDENIPLLSEALKDNERNGFHLMRFQGRILTSEDLRGCIALCVRSTTRVEEKLLRQTPVRFVGTATSGTEHIDEDFLRSENIFFRDAKGCNANSVAEYVVFSMLLWAEKQGFMSHKQALQGKTLGIIGYGRIGQRVATLAQKMGLRVIVSDPPFLESGGMFAQGIESMPLQAMLRECDILTNHVPYTLSGKHQTVGMLDNQILNLLRTESLFIHASRGGIVVESGLLDAIEDRAIQAVIDVWHNEPNINPILANKSLLATPHIAGYSYEGKINGSKMIAQALVAFIERAIGKHLAVDWDVFEEALLKDKSSFRPDFTNHKGLLEALRQSRQLEWDSAQLLASLGKSGAESSFDYLRKTYPQRREILFSYQQDG